MSQGPILIFDKSALQALSVDEAVWLDNFQDLPQNFSERTANFIKQNIYLFPTSGQVRIQKQALKAMKMSRSLFGSET